MPRPAAYDPQDVIGHCEPCGFPIFAGYDYIPLPDGALVHPGACAAGYADTAARIAAAQHAPHPDLAFDVDFDGDTTTSAQPDYNARVRADRDAPRLNLRGAA